MSSSDSYRKQVEAVAERLWLFWHPSLPWDEQKDSVRAEYRDAAIAALEEPEEAWRAVV